MVYHSERKDRGTPPSFRGTYDGNFATDAENVTDKRLTELISLPFSSALKTISAFLPPKMADSRKARLHEKGGGGGGDTLNYSGTITLAEQLLLGTTQVPHIRITYLHVL